MPAPTSPTLREAIDRSVDQAANVLRSQLAYWIAGLTIALLTPFFVYRAVTGAWLVVAILASLLVAMVGVIAYLRRGGSGLVAVHVVLGVCGVGLVTASFSIGLAGMLWVYPLVVAAFYSLPRRSALVINALVAASVIPVVADDPALGTRVVATVALVFLLGWVFSDQLDRQRRELARLAMQDTLTGAGNRRALDEALAQLHYHKARYSRPVSLLMLDLDHFKHLNDRIGHQGGDQVLSDVAAHLMGRLRRSDRVFRFGGEEFVVVLTETSLPQAMCLSEELRDSCTSLRIAGGQQLTFSGGVAELGDAESIEDWLRRADQALYRAKAQGRNRILEAKRPGA
jgi:diguanylate cyclase (GGDEF)-like protein